MARQMPRCFSRIATLSPRSAVTRRNSRGSVLSPCTVQRRGGPATSSRGGAGFNAMVIGASAANCASSPSLLFLPAPRPADAGLLHAEIEFLDVLLVEEAGARALHDDAADFQHIAVIRGLERHLGILLDEEDADAALPVDAQDDLENIL